MACALSNNICVSHLEPASDIWTSVVWAVNRLFKLRRRWENVSVDNDDCDEEEGDMVLKVIWITKKNTVLKNQIISQKKYKNKIKNALRNN